MRFLQQLSRPSINENASHLSDIEYSIDPQVQLLNRCLLVSFKPQKVCAERLAIKIVLWSEK